MQGEAPGNPVTQGRTDAPRFAPVAVSRAYELVSSAIEQEIVAGRLVPGDPLPPEAALAEQFNVNRSTVREGLRMLEHAGLVRRGEGKRLIVALPRYLDLAARASRALAMHRVSFLELWEAAMAIEPLVTGFAAVRASAEHLQGLERNIVAMESHLDDIDRVVELDMAFHNLLGEATGNRALVLAREPIGLLFRPAGEIILPRLKTQRRVLDAHKQIFELVRRHDVDAATDWMRRHMADFKRGYEATGVRMDQPLDAQAGSASA